MTRPCTRPWTRRDTLKLAGAATTALAAGRLGAPALAQAAGRIDVHHHWHPPPITDAFQGVNIGASWPGGEWSVGGALSLMDRFDIRTGMLSVRNPRARRRDQLHADALLWHRASDVGLFARRAARARRFEPHRFRHGLADLTAFVDRRIRRSAEQPPPPHGQDLRAIQIDNAAALFPRLA